GKVEAVRIDLRAQGLRAATRNPARRQFEIREFQIHACYLELVAPNAFRIQSHHGPGRLVEPAGVRDPVRGQVGTERNCELAEGALRRSAHARRLGNREPRRYLRSYVSERPEIVEQNRIKLQRHIDGDSRSVQDALIEQGSELSRRLDVALVAQKGEFRLDVERRRGVEVFHVEMQAMDANGRRLFAEIVEIELAVLDAERLYRQLGERRSLSAAAPGVLVLRARRFAGVRPYRAQIEVALRV